MNEVLAVADNFKDTFNNLGLALHTKEQFDAYYVGREDSPIIELYERINMDSSPSKILFTGLRACGKTTELRRLSLMLNDEFFVVYFSAMDELALVDIDYKDLILSLILQTLNATRKRGIDLNRDIQELLYDLLGQISGEIVISKVEKESKELGIGGKLSLLILELTGRYRSEIETRKEIRSNTEHLIQDLIHHFNSLIVELQNKIKKDVIIIIDDLEKADLKLAEDIFYKHSYSLAQPSCKIIYTVPLPLKYAFSWKHVETNFLGPHYFLPVKAVKTKEGEDDHDGINFLKSIILKRGNSNLFEEGILEKIAICSGGVVVDYLRMIRDCCVKARARKIEKINEDLCIEAFSQLVDDYWRPLETKYYEKLSEVSINKDTDNDVDLRFLLNMNAILEYNGKRWYDAHPAVNRILLERGYV